MKILFAGVLIVMCVVSSMAQEETETRTLTQQYKALNADMEVIDGYRTVRLFVMDKFWNTVMDSLTAERKQKLDSRKEVAELKQEVATLKAKLSTQSTENAELEHATAHIKVLGIDFSKGSFIGISFTSVAVLAGLLVFAVLSTRMCYRAVKDMKRLYENTSQEFEHYKHNAVEKEIKLSRELQDFRNKFSEVST